MYAKFAVRDASLIAAAFLFWWVAADLSGGSGAIADFTGFVAGLLVGATGFILHEWGHLLAAFASRSAVEPNRKLRSGFIFSFDARSNSLGQFLVMSSGGFVVTAAIVWSFYAFLPDHLLATRIARLCRAISTRGTSRVTPRNARKSAAPRAMRVASRWSGRKA